MESISYRATSNPAMLHFPTPGKRDARRHMMTNTDLSPEGPARRNAGRAFAHGGIADAAMPYVQRAHRLPSCTTVTASNETESGRRVRILFTGAGPRILCRPITIEQRSTEGTGSATMSSFDQALPCPDPIEAPARTARWCLAIAWMAATLRAGHRRSPINPTDLPHDRISTRRQLA